MKRTFTPWFPGVAGLAFYVALVQLFFTKAEMSSSASATISTTPSAFQFVEEVGTTICNPFVLEIDCTNNAANTIDADILVGNANFPFPDDLTNGGCELGTRLLGSLSRCPPDLPAKQNGKCK
ncbi:MAG: hypothetical protein ACK4TA_18260 [Saprospiraceae bacterium]